MSEKTIEAYWQKFLSALPEDSPYRTKTYSEGGYGDSPELMDELIQLVLEGKKTATCGSIWEWEAEGESIPKVGDVWIEPDGSGNPVCITETIEVTIRNYNEVDAQFAHDEVKATNHSNIGARHTESSSRVFSQKQERNFQKICLWFVNGSE